MSAAASASRSAGDSSSTSVSLLDRARRQEERAWERLVELYGPLVYRWCRQWGLSPSDAADAGQEVLQGVWLALPSFAHSGRTGAFRRWLKTIAHNKGRDLWRRKRVEPAAGAVELPADLADRTSPATDVDEDRADEEERNWLYRRAVELLQTDFVESTWRAFWMVVIDGRPAQDVAEELGLTVNAVYIAKSRVLSRLRAEFADLVE
jgi:RNA polymerase sigma-70 factor (ECF subfamily)